MLSQQPTTIPRQPQTSEWVGTYALPLSARSPGLARMRLQQALADRSPEKLETAELLVSELVTNAIRHGKTPVILQIKPTRLGFRVTVEDGSVDPIVFPPPTPDERVGGYGLSLVDALAASWGWVRTIAGKQVWFEL